jgi:hypothetical protein
VEGDFIVRDEDGIRQITAEQAQEARREYASALRITSEIIGGLIRIDLDEFERLPFVFTRVLNIHRDFIREQTKDE